MLAIARSLREQIDWPSLRARVAASPYALAFFTLVEELGIAPAQERRRTSASSRVRVLSSSG